MNAAWRGWVGCVSPTQPVESADLRCWEESWADKQTSSPAAQQLNLPKHSLIDRETFLQGFKEIVQSSEISAAEIFLPSFSFIYSRVLRRVKTNQVSETNERGFLL